MDMVILPPLARVAICGGTHGNELSGVYLVREWQKKEKEERKKKKSVSVVAVLSNHQAVKQCRRYTEMDLNRCFTSAILSTPVVEGTPYEVVRAQELNAFLGPRGSAEAVDLMCDLHNTTANMGICLISYLDCDWITLHIYKHLQSEISAVPVRYLHLGTPVSEAFSLDSVGKHGTSMEVGPQPHGVLRADVYNVMKNGVQLMLDWIDRFNSGVKFEGGEVEIYTVVRSIDYPRDPETQTITAVIHPQLQDRDFCILHPGDPIFQYFSGETQYYEGEEALFPVFVNESAYYEKGSAMKLTRMRKVMIPAVQVEGRLPGKEGDSLS